MVIVAMVEDAVEQEIAAARLGVSLRQTLNFYQAVKMLSRYGLCLVPMEFLNRLLEMLKPEELEALAKEYRGNGAMLGAYLQSLGEDEALNLLRRIFETGIFNVTDLDLSKKDRFLEVKCIAPTLTNENTRLLLAFLEGILEGIGYKVTKKDYARGIITLTVKR